MALRVLLLKKQLDAKRRSRASLETRAAELQTREAELSASIDEVNETTSLEDRSALETLVSEFEADKAALQNETDTLEGEIRELEGQIAAEEAAQNTEPPAAPTNPAAGEERKDENAMNINTREKFFGKMSVQERTAFFARDDVKGFLANVRTGIKQKRAIENIGLLIPEVMLPLLRENIINYSKLYRHVTVRTIRGEGRVPIMGAVPEAVWTECCANLNELDITFNDAVVDCYMVAGYFAVCNANIEDADIDLLSELLDAIGQAIGLALDKAILYGRNSEYTQKMPQGIVSRLLEFEQPTGYPATARPWADLTTTNVITLPADKTGAQLFQEIVLASGAAKGRYSRGGKVWVMNETTYTFLVANALVVDAGGAIVSGVNGTMPVTGGDIEVLNFVPDGVIIGGFFDLYLLAERRGPQFATSDHVRFLQSQTVMKGTARYDGLPVIAEAFVVIGVMGVEPKAEMEFASDTANAT